MSYHFFIQSSGASAITTRGQKDAFEIVNTLTVGGNKSRRDDIDSSEVHPLHSKAFGQLRNGCFGSIIWRLLLRNID